jgi:uncharacterized membrane protein YbhN (UPF0104 family)/ubiquinone/menaquinone biosynthesis C-methylase UbiE
MKRYCFLKIVVAVLLLTGLCFYISPHAMLDAIAGMNVKWLAVAALLMPLFLMFRVLKWYYLIHQIDQSLRLANIFPSYLRGMLVGLFTPLRLGEATRALGTGHAASNFVLFIVEKMIEVACLLALCSIALIKLESTLAWVLLPLLIIALFSRRAFAYVGIRCLRLSHHFFGKPSADQLPMAVSAVERLKLWGCTVLSLCVFFIFMSQVYLVMLGMDYNVPISTIFNYPIVLIGNTLPVTVGGFGIRETIAVFLLEPQGISAAVAMSGFAFIGTVVTLFILKGRSSAVPEFENETFARTASETDSEGWDQFWCQRDRRPIGRLLSWVRRRFVTPKLVALVLKNTERGTLVEAGCGTGEVSLQSAKLRGDRVVLVDRSRRALVMAQRRSRALGVDADILQCDIVSLSAHVKSIPDATAFNIGVIEHFPDCSRVLLEMAKVSGRGAFAVIPERSFFWRVFVVATTWLGFVPDDFFIRLYSRDTLRSAVERVGLKVLGMERARVFGVIPYLGVTFERQYSEEHCNV